MYCLEANFQQLSLISTQKKNLFLKLLWHGNSIGHGIQLSNLQSAEPVSIFLWNEGRIQSHRTPDISQDSETSLAMFGQPQLCIASPCFGRSSSWSRHRSSLKAPGALTLYLLTSPEFQFPLKDICFLFFNVEIILPEGKNRVGLLLPCLYLCFLAV